MSRYVKMPTGASKTVSVVRRYARRYHHETTVLGGPMRDETLGRYNRVTIDQGRVYCRIVRKEPAHLAAAASGGVRYVCFPLTAAKRNF